MAISGKYDPLLPIFRRERNFIYVLFSDDRPRISLGWTWMPFPEVVSGMDSTFRNRWCKFFPHKCLPDYGQEVSVYLDGNVMIRGRLRPLIQEFLASGADIGLFQHPHRSSIIEEANACKALNKISLDEHMIVDAQVSKYSELLGVRRLPLTENGVIFRRSGRKSLVVAMELWWNEFIRGVKRDQISLSWSLFAAHVNALVWERDRCYRYDVQTFLGPIAPHCRSNNLVSLCSYYGRVLARLVFAKP